MARKLKSDKLLFTATLALVCASLVMVYSASAVIGMEQYNQRQAKRLEPPPPPHSTE